MSQARRGRAVGRPDYRHRPRRPQTRPEPSDRAWQAQIRLHRRSQDLTDRGKRVRDVLAYVESLSQGALR